MRTIITRTSLMRWTARIAAAAAVLCSITLMSCPGNGNENARQVVTLKNVELTRRNIAALNGVTFVFQDGRIFNTDLNNKGITLVFDTQGGIIQYRLCDNTQCETGTFGFSSEDTLDTFSTTSDAESLHASSSRKKKHEHTVAHCTGAGHVDIDPPTGSAGGSRTGTRAKPATNEALVTLHFEDEETSTTASSDPVTVKLSVAQDGIKINSNPTPLAPKL